MDQATSSVLGLAVAVFVLIFLAIRTKVHPLIAMLIAACIAGGTGGLTMDETMNAITRGFGTTLGNIGLVIGLGVMMGRILEVSGAAEKIALTFIKLLGKKKEEWALAITGYIVSIPIFVDSAFVILFPIAKAMAKRGNRNLLTVGIALAGGLMVTHMTVPPTPGPLGTASIFGVDIGAMMIMGLVMGIPGAVSFVVYAKWIERKLILDNELPLAAPEDMQEVQLASAPDKILPGLALSLMPIVLPIGLIFLKAILQLIPEQSLSTGSWVVLVFGFLGNPVIAVALGTLIAVYTLTGKLSRQATSLRLEEGLQSAGIILLVTGAGGALGVVVRDSGTGTTVANLISTLPVSPIMLPFIVATLIRFVQGSGTVACITSASITAPILAEVPEINMLFAAQSAVLGAFFFSYFNDSLFWIVNRMMGVAQVQQQLMVWSIPTTIAWAAGGISIALVNLLFGSGGTLFDPLFPLIVLAVVLVVIRMKTEPT